MPISSTSIVHAGGHILLEVALHCYMWPFTATCDPVLLNVSLHCTATGDPVLLNVSLHCTATGDPVLLSVALYYYR